MGKRIVIALGGNALGSNLPEQMIAVKQTAKELGLSKNAVYEIALKDSEKE